MDEIGPDTAGLDDRTEFIESVSPASGPVPSPRSASPVDPTGSTGASGREGSAGLPPARFVPGEMVAERYRIVGLLGRGGMGEVYRADDLKLGQPVALKFLPRGLEQDSKRLELFLNEVRTARQVTHPNVCRVYDIGEVGGQHFLSMEYVDGEDLASLLRRVGHLPQQRAVTVARQVCAGVAAAHDRGILHRDLKPANVMIDGRGEVRLTDFGLAGLAEGMGSIDARVGTPAYMAPEQVSGGEVSARSDIYSLGLVLYELFTGRPAFSADSLAELQEQHRTSAPSRLTTHIDGLDPAVERAVLHCLEKDPKDRPGSALSVSAALPGGDPLAAALAAGETPSPELLAEVGRRDGMTTIRAWLLAIIGLSLFFGATRWAGMHGYLEYLPLEKRPEVLTDRAQGILEELRYVEPAYSDPVDQAWGLLTWNNVFEQVAAADSSSTRWEGLRDRPDAAAFWYRQSPRPLVPAPGGAPVFVRGAVSIGNPTATSAGEVTVVLDLSGRLRRLEVIPKRFATEGPSAVDWEPLFAFADLEPGRFTEVEPRYQRWFAPDLRQAWVGTRAESPEVELRVEAGAHQGRPILFNVSTPGSLDDLAEDPEPSRLGLGTILLQSIPPLVILVIVLMAFRLIHQNRVRGRVDGLGATRFSALLFLLFVLANGLKSHALFSRDWASEIWPLISGGVFLGVVGWSMYLAAEPLGRRVWPTMFVSSSRLLSRSQIQWRDPLIGRSVLVALVAGAALFTWHSLGPRMLEAWRSGAPPELHGYNLTAVVGQRQALGWILDQPMLIGMAVIQVVALVVCRWLVGHQVPALALALLVWTVTRGIGTFEQTIFSLVGAAASMFLLLRWGVVSFIAMQLFFSWAWLARSSDLSAWHSRPAVMSLVVVGLLAFYGAWAATGGSQTKRPQE